MRVQRAGDTKEPLRGFANVGETKEPLMGFAPEPPPGVKHVLSSPPEPVEGGRVEGFAP